MKKVFLDTNVFLRFFVPEDETSFKLSKNLLSLIQEGSLIPYTSNIVFLECYFVLTRTYKFPREKVSNALLQIAAMRNMTIIEKTNTKKALKFWQETGVKLADCLIATQIGKGIPLCTYDTEFKKFPFLSVVTPERVV